MNRQAKTGNLMTTASVLLMAVLAAILAHQVYTLIDAGGIRQAESKEEYIGEIETPQKLLLNGYLGVFSRFGSLGNINWLAIPLLIWFLATWKSKKREPWQLALAFVWLGIVLLVSIKGFANPRYQLTLLPFTIAAVLLLLWQLLENRHRYLRLFVFWALTGFCLFNISHYFEDYKNLWELRFTVQRPYFPQQLFDYIHAEKDINRKSRVFVINQPIFYYHTGKMGKDYMNPSLVEAWAELQKKKGSRAKVFRILKKKHGVNYVLISSFHRRFSRDLLLEEFLHCDCRLVMEDNGRLLFKLNPRLLEDEIKSPVHTLFKLWHGKPAATGIEEVSPSLFRLSRRGIFKFDLDHSHRILTLRLVRYKKRERPRIQFGYEFNRMGLPLDVKKYEGYYVNFIVRAAVSPGLVQTNNRIMVMDYVKETDDWESEQTVFTTGRWRTYKVSRKIRPGAERVICLFRFSPMSAADRMRISDARIVISEQPL